MEILEEKELLELVEAMESKAKKYRKIILFMAIVIGFLLLGWFQLLRFFFIAS